ncbi:hypothetical protein GGR25_004840 [Kaistia hirudinis]|uniref:Uncharacterized protein n=1 Tax=Kaistia hirudinis TaxID=1293440 RepID=A0A840AVR3_9HYPH|nr:hypothetical protein [Kaistia hirudinis]MBB3933762.1 hypothetical protein [Kaistia hirudinis]
MSTGLAKAGGGGREAEPQSPVRSAIHFASRQAALIRARFAALTALLLLVAVAGCTIQLSPAFDADLYKTVTELNVKAETLFAKVSGGGTAANFKTSSATYDALIGGFSAARLAADARGAPPMGVRLAAQGSLKKICADDPTACVNPTPHNLGVIVALLTDMRDSHKSGRLPAYLVAGFKNRYEIYMNRVLVFEAALNR